MPQQTYNYMSDTVTKPGKEMLEYMMSAEVGDDVFGDDPTVNKLEQHVAELFAHEAALFCPSGTMTNQIAIKAQTQPLDEVICDKNAHIYWSEVGGYAFHSQVGIRLIDGKEGIILPHQVTENINPSVDWMTSTKMLCIENTGNKAGGNCYSMHEMQALRTICDQHQLIYHLDGARIFNAIIENNYTTQEIGKLFHSISVCFSKGLGAPVGSVLIGNKSTISKARKIRKVMGGGMRQAGYLAAGCLFALEHNISALKKDHEHAQILAQELVKCHFTEYILPVKTNIIIVKIKAEITASSILEQLHSYGIIAVPFGNNTIRFVTHLNLSTFDVEATCDILNRHFMK